VSFEATANSVSEGRFGKLPMECERRRDGELVPGPDFRGSAFSRRAPIRGNRFRLLRRSPRFDFSAEMIGDFVGPARTEGIVLVEGRFNRRGKLDRDGRLCTTGSVDWTARRR
jgi:hypothetical protein